MASCGKHNLDLTEDGAKVPTLTMISSIQDGTFSQAPSFDLTLSKSTETSEIRYCVSAGVSSERGCCDPTVEGVATQAASVSGVAGSSDGNYCLAYIGFTDSETSDINTILFNIDTSAPDLNITTPRRMVQSSQYIDLAFDSTDLGRTGFFFSALNYGSAQGTDCDVINSDTNFSSNGIDFNQDSSPDTLDMSGESGSYAQTLRGKDLAQYGDNYIYFALVDISADPMRTSCPGINIVLNDFNVFEFSTNGDLVPNGNGELEAAGGFNSFGGGVFVGSTNTTKLQTGLLNIIH